LGGGPRSGLRWGEGPVWFGDARHLLCSDIPNNRILRWDEASGATSVYRYPSNNANGHCRDRQGRLLGCEHLTRRVTRTEYDGSITVLADNWQGKRLNSPNDIVCQSNGAIWFTDPSFGIAGWWEGHKAEQEVGPEGTSDGLPPELAKASEILVTRRYFRSGDSEYFINQAPCRLKDITELFLGTGVGTKAYAIIEQGRVEQLVNAKPEEMRHFIEEAAGTTRFRARKVAAERKMERTRDNLLRVQDVIRELERQMASLQRQAKRAEEYHRLKDELRGLDFRVMGARHRVWSAEITAHEAALGLLHDEERALLEAMERRAASTEAARAARHDLETRLRAVDEELTQARVRTTEMQARGEAAAARREDLERRIATAAGEATRLAERLEEGIVRRRGHEQERADCDVAEREAATRLESAERELRELDAAGAPLEREVEVAKDALVEALEDEVRLRNLGEALERRRDELQGKRIQLEEEQRALGARLDGNAREREAAERAPAESPAR